MLNNFFNSIVSKRIQILLFVSLSFCINSKSQNPKNNFQSGEKIIIPFEYVNNFIIVDIFLHRKLPLKFILDTGAQHTIITKKEIAAVLGLEYVKEFKIVGADMERELIANLITNVGLKIGNLEEENLQMLVLDEDYFLFEELTGLKIQGILGGNFLKKYVVELDYKKKKLIIHHPSFFKPNKKYNEIPLDINNEKPFVKSNLVFQNLDTLNESILLIDSGAGVTLMLESGENEEITIPENAVPGNIGTGLGGDLIGYFGMLPEFSFGKYKLKNIPTNFQVIENDSIKQNLFQRNGLIGNQILDRFKVIIDYRRDKLYLHPNKRLNKPFKFDKSGIAVIASGLNLGKYLIQSVMRYSPAGEAGLKPGDQILSLNYIPSNLLSIIGITNKLKRREGKKIRMVIKRDGVKQVVRFKLRNLVEKLDQQSL